MRRVAWFALLALVGTLVVVSAAGRPTAVAIAGARGERLDGRSAHGFRLMDRFGRPWRLADFHGKTLVLTFTDTRCTDTCPLEAQTVARLRGRLGSRAEGVRLLAVNANPEATAVSGVRAWSGDHDMTARRYFLTAPRGRLEAV